MNGCYTLKPVGYGRVEFDAKNKVVRPQVFDERIAEIMNEATIENTKLADAIQQLSSSKDADLFIMQERFDGKATTGLGYRKV